MLVLAANALICLVTYVYMRVLYPVYMVPQVGLFCSSVALAFGLFLLANIIFNYWTCVLTRPGIACSIASSCACSLSSCSSPVESSAHFSPCSARMRSSWRRSSASAPATSRTAAAAGTGLGLGLDAAKV